MRQCHGMIPGAYLTRVPLKRYARIFNDDVYTNPRYLRIHSKVRDLRNYVNRVTPKTCLLIGLFMYQA